MSTRRKFIEKSGWGILGISVASGHIISCKAPEAVVTPFSALPRSTPEMQGVSSRSLLSLLDAIAESELDFHSIMVVKNGNVITEGWWSPFATEYKHTLYSLSKSFTSTAVGMAIDDGLLTVEDTVISFFPNDLPSQLSDNLKAMKIKHLLTMNTGHSEKPMGPMQEAADDNWARAFLAQEVTHTPGSHYLYNTGASYLLSHIVQNLVGMPIHEYLDSRLLQPLNITGSDWEQDPNGVNVGGYGLRLTTEDIAKFGQLYLQNGKWEEEQLISEHWVSEATKLQTTSQEGDNDWSQGYGYQFWRCKPEPGFYRGDGAFGQYCIVIPQMDTVIAVTSESSDMQKSMNVLWDHLLPHLSNTTALDTNTADQSELKSRLQSLQLEPHQVLSQSANESMISDKVYTLDSELADTIAFSFRNGECTLHLSNAKGPKSITAGNAKWHIGDNIMNVNGSLFVLPDDIMSKVAASYTWEDEDTLAIELRFVEAIHTDIWRCTFSGDEISIAFDNSINALRGQEESRPPVIGKVQV